MLGIFAKGLAKNLIGPNLLPKAFVRHSNTSAIAYGVIADELMMAKESFAACVEHLYGGARLFAEIHKTGLFCTSCFVVGEYCLELVGVNEYIASKTTDELINGGYFLG